MIDVYTWPTPNGHKVHIMLEECGLEYAVHAVDIGKGQQFAPDFLSISPGNKIPAIVDQDGPDGAPYSVFESGAILFYLGHKSGRFLPSLEDTRGTFHVVQWLMFQMASVGPMFGQANHFRRYSQEKIPYAIERYTRETGRLLGVLDKRLEQSAYLAGPHYTIADIAVFPWVRAPEKQGHIMDDYPHLKHWCDRIEARPAVQRGLAVLSGARPAQLDEEARENLYGNTQYRRRPE